MHNRYDTGRIVDLEKQIAELQEKLSNTEQFFKNVTSDLENKLHRRNMLIKDLKKGKENLYTAINQYEKFIVDKGFSVEYSEYLNKIV